MWEDPTKKGRCVSRSMDSMGSNRLPNSQPNPTKMGNEHSKSGRRLPEINFRVLIIGRANAGKTSILQRVCDTTDSPAVYRRTGDGKMNEKVRGRGLL